MSDVMDMRKYSSKRGESNRDRRDKRVKRDKTIQTIKNGGSLIMYIGSAGLVSPMIQNARKEQNGAMQICTIGAGAVVSMGVGAFASSVFGKIVDKVVDFWDDVKPKKKENDTEEDDDEDEDNE